MNASNHSTQVKRDSEGSRSTPAAPVMQPVDRVLDLVTNASRFDDPWYWRDRWAD